MKMNRKTALSLISLILCGMMILPLLTSCGGGSLEIHEKQEEVKTVETAEEIAPVTSVLPVTQEEVKTEEVEKDPLWDYIPPENYINYTDNDNLNATPNAGAGGNRVVLGGEGEISKYTYTQYENANSATLFTAADRRNVAEAEMRSMLTFRWTPAETTVYSYNAGAYTNATTVDQAAFDANKITLEKGKIYQGLPYTLGSGNVAAFAYGVTPENGLYTVPVTTEILSGGKVSSRIGVDDVDALFWAWARVAPSPTFTDTATMISDRGVLPVGEYELTAEAKTSLAGVTDDVVALNGEAAMYAAYAKLQKADGLVADTDTAKHAMLAVSATIVNGADGKIDPNASYVTVLEQTDANLVAYEALSDAEKAALKDKALAIGGIDVKYSFAELYAGGYLPVTCEELNKDGKVEDVYAVDSFRVAGSAKSGSGTGYNKNRLFAGGVTANRRIVYLNQKFTNKNGEVVLDITTFPHEGGAGKDLFSYTLTLWDDTAEIPRTRGYRNHITSGALKNFFKGDKTTYRCDLVGLLSTGEIVTFRSYNFAYN